MKIYFDMDGVLADFDSMHTNACNLNHATKDLSETERELKRKFWLDIEKQDNFWADMPAIKDINNVLNVAKSIGEIFVLSKTPGAKHFIGGQNYVDYVANEKRKWILKNMPEYFDAAHIIICDGKKGELIKPSQTDILIDDRPENITEWESCGGRGILFQNATTTSCEIKKLTQN